MRANEPFLLLILLDVDGERFGFSYAQTVGVRSGYPNDDFTAAFVSGVLECSVPGRSGDLLSPGLSTGSASVTLSLDEADLVASMNAGARLQRSRCRLFAWQPRLTLADSVLLFDGIVSDVTFERSAGTVEFNVVPDPAETNVILPGALIGDEGRFAVPPEETASLPLPVVYGTVQRMAIPAINMRSVAYFDTGIQVQQISDQPPEIPAGAVPGDFYIVSGNPGSDWAGHANEMAEWDVLLGWQFTARTAGDVVENLALGADDDRFLVFNGNTWYKSEFPPDPVITEVEVALASHNVIGDPDNPGFVKVGNDEDGDSRTPKAVLSDVDGLGQPYSYVVCSIAEWDSSIYVVSLAGKSEPGSSTRPLHLLGDVLTDVWRSNSKTPLSKCDTARISSATSRLNRFAVAMPLNDQQGDMTLFDVIGSRLAGQFPFVFGYPNGLMGWEAIVWPRRTDPAAVHLIFGQNAHNRGPVSETGVADVINRYEASYLIDGKANGEALSITLDADSSEMLRASQALYGKSVVEKLRFPDAPTAGDVSALVLNEAHRTAFVRLMVSYEVTDAQFLLTPLFEVVEVTDPDMGWDMKRFVVRSIAPDPKSGVIVVEMLSEDPV